MRVWVYASSFVSLIDRTKFFSKFDLVTFGTLLMSRAFEVFVPVMKFRMVAMKHYYKIRQLIVSAVSINVMNVLSRYKASTDKLLHDVPMLKDLSAISIRPWATNYPVAIMVNTPALEAGVPIAGSVFNRAVVVAKICWSVFSSLLGVEKLAAVIAINPYGLDMGHVPTSNPLFVGNQYAKTF